MKKMFFVIFLLLSVIHSFAWGFYGHRKINYHAVFLLPPEMLVLFKPSLDFLTEHATDPDKRRYAVVQEAPRHYIDLDHYGNYPYPELPRKWNDAVAKYSEDSLHKHGIVPWWLQIMLQRLTDAFREKSQSRILKYAADIGHYIADAHVPLHTSSNHNGQKTGQRGIHGFWESRVPESLAEKEWDFFIGKARYIKNPAQFIWNSLLESAAASDSVLLIEKQLSRQFPADRKFSYELRNGQVIRQYSTAYTIAYDRKLNGMVERRMRQSIYAVACFWYTAWLNAGQPDLKQLQNKEFTTEEIKEFGELSGIWREHE
jgi:hypothetical protein